MDQSQTTPPDSDVEEQAWPPEEVIQELVHDIESLLGSGQQTEALGRFAQLHPVDQGEVLDGLSREIRHSLLAELDPWVLAATLEYLEPEASAEMVGGREPANLAKVLDFTGPDVAVDLLRPIPEEIHPETLRALAYAATVT